VFPTLPVTINASGDEQPVAANAQYRVTTKGENRKEKSNGEI
jgi:hypothetical protein